MITRSAPVGAVCFRCRLRLLHQVPRSRHIASDAPSSSAPTSAPRTHDAINRDVPGGDATDSAAATTTDHDKLWRHVTSAEAENYQTKRRAVSGVKYLDHRRRHRSNRRLFIEDAVTLETPMLGKPAYAVVMKEDSNYKIKEKKKLTPAPTESYSEISADIDNILDGQKKPLTLTEVRSTIDGLRPVDTVLLGKDFNNLKASLMEGFLNIQIQDYIAWYRLREQAESLTMGDDAPVHPEFPWILEMTRWLPLKADANTAEEVRPVIQGYISDSTSTKERLVVRLMRDCWGLSIAELHDQLGETRVRIRSREFTLLLRGTRRFLSTLSRIWLEPGEKIEAIPNQNVLRLVTKKFKIDSVLKDLGVTLGNIVTQTFPVQLVTGKGPNAGALDERILKELGRITNTHIRTSHTERRLHVTWIGVKSRATQGFEDLAHVVFRLLLTASTSPQTTSTLLSPTIQPTEPGRLIVDATNRDKIGWKDKLAQWARYVYPQTREENTAGTALPIKAFELPFEPLRRPESLKESPGISPESRFPFHPSKWSDTSPTSTVAHFGHVLHPYHQSSHPINPLSTFPDGTEKRIFSSLTPHPIHLAKFAPDDLESPLVTTKSTLLIRFWPSPSSNPPSQRSKKHAADTPPAPILELRLVVSEGKVQKIESLRAISRTHHTDIMLPSSLVDLRITQTRYETLQTLYDVSLHEWQPLAQFFENARLDIENGKLEMPPRQRFPIPRRLLLSESSTPPTESSAEMTTENSESTNQPKEEEEEEGEGEEGEGEGEEGEGEDGSPAEDHQPEEHEKSPLENQQKHEDEAETKDQQEHETEAADQRTHDETETTTEDSDIVSVSYEFVGLELHRSITLPYEGHQMTYTSIEAGQGGGRRAEVTLEPLESPLPTSPLTDTADNSQLQTDFLECCTRFVADRKIWSGHGGPTRS